MRFPSLAVVAAALLPAWGCAAISGLDSLTKVECLDSCDGGAGLDGASEPVESGGSSDVESGSSAVEDGGEAGRDGGLADASDGAVPLDGASDDTGTEDAAQDASVDAPSEVDASDAGFCASLVPPPALCADFDEGTSYTVQFPQSTQPSTGHLGADGAYASSPPNSFFATVDQGTSGSGAIAYASHTFASKSSSIELAFDVMLENYVAGQYGVVAGIVLNTTPQHILTLAISSTGAEVEQSFTGADGGLVFIDAPVKPAPTAKKWTRIDITMSLAQHTVTVLVGGTSALASTSLDSSWPSSGSLIVELGLTYVATTSSAWSARFDDVVANPQ